MSWDIVVTDLERGDSTRRTFTQPTVRIGRHSEAELVLKHTLLSRTHLTLTREGDRCIAEDSSKNGSFVREGEDLTRLEGRAILKLPVTIRVGGFDLLIDYRDEEDWNKSVIIPAGNLVKRTEAIMVFDLCESSRLANENDHMAWHLKARVQQLAEPVLQSFDLRFFKGTGDGFLATFPSASKAVKAARELVDRIEQRNARTTNPPIHYRISLHHGETWEITAGGVDMHGNDLNIAFRIEGVQAEAFDPPPAALPRMDRIVCSRALTEECASEEHPEVAFQPLGQAHLKGIENPVDLLLVVAA